MGEMVERVARALTIPSGAYPYERIAQDNEALGALFDMARAAIAAMREPTVEMLLSQVPPRKEFTGIGDAWRGMIDEALK